MRVVFLPVALFVAIVRYHIWLRFGDFGVLVSYSPSGDDQEGIAGYGSPGLRPSDGPNLVMEGCETTGVSQEYLLIPASLETYQRTE